MGPMMMMMIWQQFQPFLDGRTDGRMYRRRACLLQQGASNSNRMRVGVSDTSRDVSNAQPRRSRDCGRGIDEFATRTLIGRERSFSYAAARTRQNWHVPRTYSRLLARAVFHLGQGRTGTGPQFRNEPGWVRLADAAVIIISFGLYPYQSGADRIIYYCCFSIAVNRRLRPIFILFVQHKQQTLSVQTRYN